MRLGESTLGQLKNVVLPDYERSAVSTGIVHLGIGSFHRAHQAVYTDTVLATGDTRWGIVGVSLRSAEVKDALVPQDCLYTVQTLDTETPSYRVIGSVLDSLSRPTDLKVILQRIANPQTQVVTLTITEKGYCVNSNGMLDLNHPDIDHDIAQPSQPNSAIGLLALGLVERQSNNGAPITVLSCDNLSTNGKVTRNAVLAFIEKVHPHAFHWVNDNVSFPSSMVDRIVPQPTQALRSAFEQQHGIADVALIAGEPFSQWVIEDKFAGERPPWDRAGAVFTDNVAPFEQAKLRLLNATHSTFAYLGLLAGHSYIHEAVQDPALYAFAKYLLDEEIIPTVLRPEGVNLEDYKASVLERFSNPAVPYRTHQVAADGSQKLPQRIYPIISDQLANRRSIAALSLVVAGWLHVLENSNATETRTTKSTATIKPISDPLAADVTSALQQQDADSAVRSVAEQTSHFGTLSNSDSFLSSVSLALDDLRNYGSVQCAQHALNNKPPSGLY